MRKSRKRIIPLLLLTLFLLLMFAPLAVYANGVLIDGEMQKRLEKAEEEAGIMDGFIIRQANNFFNIGPVNSLNNLIFGNPYEVWMDADMDEPIYYGLFYERELNTFIIPLMGIFGASYVIFMTLSIMIASLKMGFGAALSPQAKADFWQDVQMWIVSAFFMGTFWWISQILFSLNEGLVQSVLNVVERMGIDMNGLSIISQAGSFSIGDILVFFVEWGLALYMNFIYIARKVIIIIFMILAPLAAISLLYARTRAFFGTWFKEFSGNIFLQSIHAIVMAIFAGLASLGAGTIFKIGMLIMFIPVTGMISRFMNFGDSSSSVGRIMGMVGLSGVAGLVALSRHSRGVFRGENSSESRSIQNYGNDGNTTAITQAARGLNSSVWQKSKTALGFVGAGVGGAVGLGFGGPAGAVAGGFLGKKAFTVAGQSAYSAVVGSSNTVRTIKEAHKTGLKNIWNDIEKRREFAGKLGESIGSTISIGDMNAGGAGRKIGHAFSGVSQNRVMAQKYGNKSLADWAKEKPGAKIELRTDGAGSAFYLIEKGKERQISPMGAADPNLKPGEMRIDEYRLGGPEHFQVSGKDSKVIYSSKGTVEGTGSSVTGGPLPGSTMHLQRIRESYIKGRDGQEYTDRRFNARNINPDDYFAHNVIGVPERRSSSNKFADRISRTNTQNLENIKSWRENLERSNKPRHSGVI